MPDRDSTVTVSELTRDIRVVLERGFHSVSVSGEISNYHRHSSGHHYFTLKDAGAQLSCAMFRGSASSLYFHPRDGMEVICRGDVSVYEPRGTYQLVVSGMQPRGIGALQEAFEKLKRQLNEEGLFAADRKKQLPSYPRRVALVTSPTGAAVRDMVSVIRRRNPLVAIILIPVQVQGAGAAEQIAQGLDLCNEYGAVDVIITGRGGGSLEDLWAFNEEVVARAIARSRIPVVSAVGHEVDVTIADHVADLRAATPSVAAELVVPSLDGIMGMFSDVSRRMGKFVDSLLVRQRREIIHLSRHWVFRKPEHAVERMSQTLDDLVDRFTAAMDRRMERMTSSAELLRQRIEAHNPMRILGRGYALVRHDGSIIESLSDVSPGSRLHLTMRDGRAETTVTGVEREA